MGLLISTPLMTALKEKNSLPGSELLPLRVVSILKILKRRINSSRLPFDLCK